MSDWRTYEIENHIQNGGGLSLSRGVDNATWTLGERAPTENIGHLHALTNYQLNAQFFVARIPQSKDYPFSTP